MRELRPGGSGAPDIEVFDHHAVERGEERSDWSAEQIIERLVARAIAEELPRDALPYDAIPVCCVESQRWPRVRPIHRACLRPRRRRNLRALAFIGALTLSFAIVVAGGLSSAYQRAGAFTEWGVATGYRNTGQRMLAGGRPELALPFLLAAREHGDESALLKKLFGDALRGRLALESAGGEDENEDGSAPPTARAWDGAADLRTLAEWRAIVTKSRYPTVAAAVEAARRSAAVTAMRDR